MEDIFSRAIATANQSMACLTKQDMANLQKFIDQSHKRLNAVKLINDHKNSIVSEAISGMINQYPSLVEPGGNCYPNRRMGNATSDVEILLRYVTYAIAAGDISILEDKCFGLKDTFQVLGVSLDSTLSALAIVKGKTVELLRTEAITDDVDLIKEVSDAFDFVVASIH